MMTFAASLVLAQITLVFRPCSRRDELKSRLSAIERASQTVAYHTWRDELCQLPVSQRLKILNRVMRRRSAAGACLSSTPIALDSYRTHFEAQFRNDYGIAPFEDAPAPLGSEYRTFNCTDDVFAGNSTTDDSSLTARQGSWCQWSARRAFASRC